MNESLVLFAGNWVSFLRGDQLVYAKVEYLRRESEDQPETVITTAGEITKGQIVEVRR